MRVLAIEDQPVSAAQLLATLRSLGHVVELATDGTNAWDRLQAGGHRVIVCDWRMPGMDGLELCRKLRKRGGDYVYFVLISTTKVTKESRELALAAGVDDFLAKPLEPDELGMRLHVAERILGYAEQVKQLESFLPVCGYCKKVRTDSEYWQEIETYLAQRQGTQITHGICPHCYDSRIRPQLEKLERDMANRNTERGN